MGKIDWGITSIKDGIFIIPQSEKYHGNKAKKSIAETLASRQSKVDAETIQNELITPWLQTTMGTEASNKLQYTIARTFGHSYPKEFEELDIDWDLLYVIGEMYNWTQEELKKKGFSEQETIPVYHPYLPSSAVPKQWKKGQEVRIKLNPATSWTMDFKEAAMFAEFLASPGSPTFVIKTFIPVKSIISTPETGIGMPGTGELVTAGGEYEALVEAVYV